MPRRKKGGMTERIVGGTKNEWEKKEENRSTISYWYLGFHCFQQNCRWSCIRFTKQCSGAGFRGVSSEGRKPSGQAEGLSSGENAPTCPDVATSLGKSSVCPERVQSTVPWVTSVGLCSSESTWTGPRARVWTSRLDTAGGFQGDVYQLDSKRWRRR